MKNSLPYYLIASFLTMSGCEVDQQSENVVSERPFGTIFDAPEGSITQSIESKEQKENKTTNFSPKVGDTNTIKVAEKPGTSLDKKDLLYGFYNSGIVGEPADFDNFFSENDSQIPSTKIPSITGATTAATTLESPFGAIFDAPEGSITQSIESKEQKENKTTNFSPKVGDTNTIKVAEKPGTSLDKKDLLYGFYNSGIVGEPADFDNFDAESDSQAPRLFGTIFDSSSVEPQDFENFLNNNNDEAPASTDLFSSNFFGDHDFEFEQEKQVKINKIKESTVIAQKNNVIADQIRNKDIDDQLVLDIVNLDKKLPISENNLAKDMKNELKNKIRLLDAETALKIAEVKMQASTRSENVVSRVEDRALSATSAVRKELMKKILSVEPDNYYQLKQREKQLEAAYQVNVATIKLKYQKKMSVLEADVKYLREANKKIIDNRISELEAQRIADALIVETRIREKNQKIVDQSYPEFKGKIIEYENSFKKRLAQKEKQENVLGRLEAKYTADKLTRKSKRDLEKKQYLTQINQKIKQEQASYEDKSRERLINAREVKINSLPKILKSSIKRVESDGAKALADLKAQNAREFQKLKSKLAAPYKKKEQALNQKYQQDKSKILSRFRSEEYAVVAKINKETGSVNREIDARVKAEIQTLLASIKTLKKEKAEKAKKIKLEEPKESPGFFESLF